MSCSSINLNEAERQIGYEIITIAALRPSIGRLDNGTIVAIFNICCNYGYDYFREPYPFYPTRYDNQLLFNIDPNGIESYYLRYSNGILANLHIIEGESALSYYKINDANIDKISNFSIPWNAIKLDSYYNGAILTKIDIIPEIYSTNVAKFSVYSDYSTLGKYPKRPILTINQERQKELNLPNWANNLITFEIHQNTILSDTFRLRYCP